MNIFKLSGHSQVFRDRRQAWLLIGLVLAASGFTVHAQNSATNQRPVRLNVVAVDPAGRPVTDLTASDFAIFDNGSPQQIVSLHLNQSDRPRPLVILFDLMNLSEESRGAVWDNIESSLAHTSAGPLYLYLLVEDGSLYPVHALPGAAGDQGAADASWTKDIGPLMNAAMHKVNQERPQDFRAASPGSGAARVTSTLHALEDLRALMAASRGPKELLWITHGIPDFGTPLLRLGAQFVQSGITVYSADPGMNLERGILSRSSLDVLTGTTGGHAFSAVDMNLAIEQINAEGRANYSIEYQPAAGNWDGKYHQLHVTVTRKKVRLQAVLGYYAVTGS